METDDEIDDIIEFEDEIETIPDKTIADHNENIRFKWYKFSARFIPEEYRFQYVHADAESRNRKKYLNGLRNVRKWD